MPSPFPPGHRVVVSEFGHTPQEALERFVSLQPQPAPDPAQLESTEVIIGVRSAGVAWVDLLMTSGQYQHMPAPPYTPGMDFSGEVLAVGSGVDPARCAVGDRVIVDFMQVGPRTHGRYARAAGFASYAVVPAAATVRIPDPLDFDQAACLLGAYETAYHCLVTRARVQAGETVLIAGATGKTGLAAVQVAKLLGATVIALGRASPKLAALRAHGADHVVDSTNEDGSPGVRRFRDEIKALTGGEGVDVVYDAVGGDTGLECLRCCAFDGRFLIVGWASTPDVARGKGGRGAPNANLLPTNIMQMKQLSVMGCPAVISVTRRPEIRAPRLATVLQWAQQGRIAPVVSRSWPLTEWKAAMLARWNGEILGGGVLKP